MTLHWDQLAHLVGASHTLIADWKTHVHVWPESINSGCVTRMVTHRSANSRSNEEEDEEEDLYWSHGGKIWCLISVRPHICAIWGFFPPFFPPNGKNIWTIDFPSKLWGILSPWLKVEPRAQDGTLWMCFSFGTALKEMQNWTLVCVNHFDAHGDKTWM